MIHFYFLNSYAQRKEAISYQTLRKEVGPLDR